MAVRRAALATGLLVALAAAACGSGGGTDDGPGADHSPSSSAPSSPGAAPASPSPSRGTSTTGAAATGAITIAFAGDVHFEGGAAAALTGGLAAITPALSAADLTVVNLETAVTDRGTPAGKSFTFRAPASAFTVLKAAGVDVVTMANNHALDYGQVGLADSLAAAKAAGMPVIGAGVDEDAAFAPHVVEVKGVKVALIGATQVLDASLATAWTAAPGHPGLASAKDVDRLVAAVEAARKQADVVAVDLHWGTELASCPTDAQRDLAPRLIAAGAQVVVGSHAHVVLGGGWQDGAYVDYGLGNFVFYARTAETEQTGVLTLTVQGGAPTAAVWTPATIRSGLPVPLTGAAATAGSAAWERLRTCTGLSATP